MKNKRKVVKKPPPKGIFSLFNGNRSKEPKKRKLKDAKQSGNSGPKHKQLIVHAKRVGNGYKLLDKNVQQKAHISQLPSNSKTKTNSKVNPFFMTKKQRKAYRQAQVLADAKEEAKQQVHFL